MPLWVIYTLLFGYAGSIRCRSQVPRSDKKTSAGPRLGEKISDASVCIRSGVLVKCWWTDDAFEIGTGHIVHHTPGVLDASSLLRTLYSEDKKVFFLFIILIFLTPIPILISINWEFKTKIANNNIWIFCIGYRKLMNLQNFINSNSKIK